jgi:hypothetical protein
MKGQCVWDVRAHERNNCFYYDWGTILYVRPFHAQLGASFNANFSGVYILSITLKRGEREIAGN